MRFFPVEFEDGAIGVVIVRPGQRMHYPGMALRCNAETIRIVKNMPEINGSLIAFDRYASAAGYCEQHYAIDPERLDVAEARS